MDSALFIFVGVPLYGIVGGLLMIAKSLARFAKALEEQNKGGGPQA